MHGLRLPALCTAGLVAAALATAAAAPAADGPAATTAKAKKCPRGTKRVKVRRHGRTTVVCRKVKAKRPASTAKGPTVAQVEAAITGVIKAQRDSWMAPEDVEVIFERPTKVLPKRWWDTDPSSSLGEIDAWPVRVWLKVVTHRDDTPEDDTRYQGCNGHRDRVWPYDSIVWFWRGSAGGWQWATDTARGIGC